MNNQYYKDVLTIYNYRADCELFFAWLEREPDFMELSELEIEINFMMRCVAELAYIKGAEREL